MTTTPVQAPPSPIALSEMFALKVVQELNLISFRLSPEVERQVGNQFSWRFCQKFPDVMVIYGEDKFFWVLAKPGETMPEKDEWREKLAQIQEELKDDIGERYYSIQWVRTPQLTASICAELAVRILKIRRPFLADTIWSDNQVEVKREAEFWAETFEHKGEIRPALALTVDSYFAFKGTLADFYENHPYRNKPEELLIGLKVRDIEKNSSATIVGLAGTLKELRNELLQYKPGSVSQTAIKESPDDQPVVAVRFGKNLQQFYYAMAALCPSITEETANKFEVKYGDLLKQTKIPYQERQKYLATYKEQAQQALDHFGFQLEAKCINNSHYKDLFPTQDVKLAETKLLFGNGVIQKRGSVLKGLSQGGVYLRHKDYLDLSKKIRISVLKIGDFKIQLDFFNQLQRRLKQYKFENINLLDDMQSSKVNPDMVKLVSIQGLSVAEARVKVEKALNELMEIPTDIVLTFLPQSDRNADNTDDGSLYALISSRLLRRGIASQIIYEETLSKPENYQNILNQVIPGILAKLGNLPFILAEPLEIADYFLGLDISRKAKNKAAGSLNVCASVRLYDKRGEFIRYRLEDALTQGEEIDKRTIEKFLPAPELNGKKVLIYRDGRFCGNEIKHLRQRAKAIGAEFILVECVKSRIPRLYEFENSQLKSPKKGLFLRLSPHEVILVTTEIKSEKVGLSLPLRLKVIPDEGQQVSLQNLVEATLKLTLLHHGALKEPRLPIPLYGSDIIAYRRLQGISPGVLDGDRQFWL